MVLLDIVLASGVRLVAGCERRLPTEPFLKGFPFICSYRKTRH